MAINIANIGGREGGRKEVTERGMDGARERGEGGSERRMD